MKFALALSLLVSSSAFAANISCGSKYFNRTDVKVSLSISASSETLIDQLVLTLDGELARKGSSIKGVDSSTSKYPNMMGFDLDSGDRGSSEWQYSNLGLRLPKGFSTMKTGMSFKALITESAPDGGSYNWLLCSVK